MTVCVRFHASRQERNSFGLICVRSIWSCEPRTFWCLVFNIDAIYERYLLKAHDAFFHKLPRRLNIAYPLVFADVNFPDNDRGLTRVIAVLSFSSGFQTVREVTGSCYYAMYSFLVPLAQPNNKTTPDVFRTNRRTGAEVSLCSPLEGIKGGPPSRSISSRVLQLRDYKA